MSSLWSGEHKHLHKIWLFQQKKLTSGLDFTSNTPADKTFLSSFLDDHLLMTVLKGNLIDCVLKRLTAVKDRNKIAPGGVFLNDPSCRICQLRDKIAEDICGTICMRISPAGSVALCSEGSTCNVKSLQRCYGNKNASSAVVSLHFFILH